MTRIERNRRQMFVPPSALLLGALVSSNWNPRKDEDPEDVTQHHPSDSGSIPCDAAAPSDPPSEPPSPLTRST